MTGKANLSEAEWRERLTPEQYHVLREGGTERAFTGKYESNKQSGLYKCAGCGAPLFASETKYNSGSGWPSYTAPVEGDARYRARHGPHRSALRQVRRPSRSCVPGWSRTERPALLHQFGQPRFRAGMT
jgi:peptide-methionine (R)-S-oxide reductase